MNHLSQLPSINFEKSKIAKLLCLKRTKTVKVIKNILASIIEDDIVKELADKKYSTSLDESIDIANLIIVDHFNEIYFK